jgi:hypothetical protein
LRAGPTVRPVSQGENCNRYRDLTQETPCRANRRAGSGRRLFGYTARPFGPPTGPSGSVMETQNLKNEMVALRERFNALRGYL